jgi:hypothetical protein
MAVGAIPRSMGVCPFEGPEYYIVGLAPRERLP